MITPEVAQLEAPIVLDRATAKPPVAVPGSLLAIGKKVRSAKQREIEAKVQRILLAVTPANGHVMMQSIIDLGYEPKFAYEMIKSMLEMDEKASKK